MQVALAGAQHKAMCTQFSWYRHAKVEEPSEEDAHRYANDIVAADVDIGHRGLPSWANSKTWIQDHHVLVIRSNLLVSRRDM